MSFYRKMYIHSFSVFPFLPAFLFIFFFLHRFRSKSFSLWTTKTKCSIQYLKHEGRANESCNRDTNHTAIHTIYTHIIYIRNGKHNFIFTTFALKHFYYLCVFIILCMMWRCEVYRETLSKHGHRGIPVWFFSLFFLYILLYELNLGRN